MSIGSTVGCSIDKKSLAEATHRRRHEEIEMGDRAIIQFKNNPFKNGIYLHWLGPREFVDAFVKCGRAAGLPDDDHGHRMLRDIIQTYAGDSDVEFGPTPTLPIADGDNGVYVVDNWRIVGHTDPCYSAAQIARFDEGFCFGERGEQRRSLFRSCMDDPIVKAQLAIRLAQRLDRTLPASPDACTAKKRL